MKYFVAFALISAASAARLDKSIYLPPHATSSGGANGDLQLPKDSFQNQHQAYKQSSSSSQAEILKYVNNIDEEGYYYAYETSDGTKAEQQGHVIPGLAPEEGSLQVSGSYSYIGDDGQTYTVTYTADENGYHAEGAHLPTPPPIPYEILKSLELTDRSRGQYDSKKSSYDADAGY